ncbi:unnamed protein product [Penicillium olsonii]|nr:unnamed protein product [Penicillium olsonii]
MPTSIHANAEIPAKRVAPTSRGSSAYARKRAVIACQVCRSRRTKCDQKKPACSFCVSIGAECVSDPPALSAFDPASVAIIERLDRLQQEFSHFARATTTASDPKGDAGYEPPPKNINLDHTSQQQVHHILKWPIFRNETNPASLRSQSPNSSVSFKSPSHWPETPKSTDNGVINDETHALLLDQFFVHVHTRNPILDEVNTRQISGKVFNRRIGWDLESCLILLVWANGAVGCPLPTLALSRKDFEQSQGVTFFYAAQQRLGIAFAHTNIRSAQCFFLAGVFLMSAIRPFDAWRMFCQALNICKIAKRTMTYSPDEAGILENLFWSSWKSEREVNRELWMPSKHPDFELPNDFPGLPAICKEENLKTWYFYLSEISAWRLETQVAEESTRFALEVSGNLEDFTRTANGLMEQVSDWQSSLAADVSITDDLEEGDMLRLILKARALYISELISWPFVYALIHDRKEPTLDCVQKWTSKGLETHLQKLNNHRVQFYHRHAGTWLMIRSCARSVGILIGASKSPRAEDLMPRNWRRAVEASLEMLLFWKEHDSTIVDVVDDIYALYQDL